ncbi:hypothetical protein D3C81_1776780 [compost metagenome]
MNDRADATGKIAILGVGNEISIQQSGDGCTSCSSALALCPGIDVSLQPRIFKIQFNLLIFGSDQQKKIPRSQSPGIVNAGCIGCRLGAIQRIHG